MLCSYARRVWCIRDSQAEFDWKSLRPSMDFTPANPLFPNLRALFCDFTKETMPLLQLALPSLIRLNVRLPWKVDLRMLQEPLRSLAETSPNIRRLEIWGFQRKLSFTKIVSDGVRGWSHLQLVSCLEIPFDVDTIAHLSRMPALTWLSFTLSSTFLAQTIPSDSVSFTTLNYLKLRARSLVPISRLLSWARLPSITDFTVNIDSQCPPKQDLVSFMASIQIAGMCHTVQKFNLEQVHDAPDTIPPREPDAPLLDLDDLRPCMAFHSLRRMNLDLQWDVDLSDDGMLTLASAWPQIGELLINTHWGWNRPGGITLNGLASLLQMCPSLISIALAIDTRGYTQMPARQLQREPPSASSFARQFRIDVLDSVIEAESVDATADCLSRIVPHFDFILDAWETWSVLEHPESDLYRERWESVHRRANKAIKRLGLNLLQELFFRP